MAGKKGVALDMPSRKVQAFYIRLGERLRRAREARGLTQAQVSELVGVGQSVISDYENAVVTVSALALYRLAEVLHVRACELVGQEPLKLPEPKSNRPGR